VHSHDLDPAYYDLQDDDIQRIRDRYGVSYWVTLSGQRSRFPIAFRNEKYQVLDLR
jgi:hypothetical protein